MKHGIIGLMMICDEEDVLTEVLNNHIRFCSAIFVLDGTQGQNQKISKDICMSYPQVVEYWRDDETGLPMPLRDDSRQFLLERARKKFDTMNWYAILHGDEIWAQDPRPFLDKRKSGFSAITVRLYHFFPHVSQRETWRFGYDVSIESLATWYMLPSIVENRLFWDTGKIDYDVQRHSRVVPVGLNTWHSDLVVKQYNYRTPQQARKRAIQRKENNWQKSHYQHLLVDDGGFFVESLALPNRIWSTSVPAGQGAGTNVMENPLPTWS